HRIRRTNRDTPGTSLKFFWPLEGDDVDNHHEGAGRRPDSRAQMRSFPNDWLVLLHGCAGYRRPRCGGGDRLDEASHLEGKLLGAGRDARPGHRTASPAAFQLGDGRLEKLGPEDPA